MAISRRRAPTRRHILAAIASLLLGSFTPAASAGLASEVAPFPGPPMVDAASAVDSRSGTLYLHGGATWAGPTDPFRYSLTSRIWRYDLETAAWDSSLSSAPGSRGWYQHAMLWDADAGVLVLHGYRNDLSAWDSLRRFDPLAARWLPATFHDSPRGAGLHSGFVRDPGGRWWHSFGSSSISTSRVAQFMDAGAAEWQLLPLGFSDELPVARLDHVAVFDARRDRLIIHGGSRGPSMAPGREPAGDCPGDLESLHAVWTIDARDRTWRRLWTSDGEYRQLRSGAIAAWSPASDAVVIFGGGQNPSPDCPLQYDPEAGLLPASLAVFDLHGNRWTELPIDADAARRFNAAGGYDPCTGTIVAAGGRSGDFDAQVRDDVVRIRVERPARVTIRGGRPGQDARGRRAIDLAFDEELPAPIDLRLMDCALGTTRDLPVASQRTGPRRYRVLVAAEVAAELDANPHLHLVGRLEGEALGFIGRTAACGPRAKSAGRIVDAMAAGNLHAAPAAMDIGAAELPTTMQVRVARSRIHLARVAGASKSSGPELRLYDVRGRLAYTGVLERGRELEAGGSDGLPPALSLPAHLDLPRGVYFAHLRWGSWEGSGKVVLGLGD